MRAIILLLDEVSQQTNDALLVMRLLRTGSVCVIALFASHLKRRRRGGDGGPEKMRAHRCERYS
jgi:hypothetical protein